jgi:hypothetical protein
MDSEIVVAIIAFCGTALGSFGGIFSSAKLINYRIKQLENKVDKHNNFAMRIPVIEKDIKVMNHRIGDLEKEHHNYV